MFLLPGGHKKEGAKRQPGRHPRIPFTAAQIETLEISYKRSAYLNSDEVIKLSNALDLSDTRVSYLKTLQIFSPERDRQSEIDCFFYHTAFAGLINIQPLKLKSFGLVNSNRNIFGFRLKYGFKTEELGKREKKVGVWIAQTK